jgi:hypothetical protein
MGVIALIINLLRIVVIYGAQQKRNTLLIQKAYCP